MAGCPDCAWWVLGEGVAVAPADCVGVGVGCVAYSLGVACVAALVVWACHQSVGLTCVVPLWNVYSIPPSTLATAVMVWPS